jgi:hypothetical protein
LNAVREWRPGRRDGGCPGLSSSPRAALLVALACGFTACDRVPVPGGPPVLEVDGQRIVLDRSATVHDVELARGGVVGEAAFSARPGDVLRFLATDARAYAIAFDPAFLQPDARTFLERSGQLRSPPLVEQGAVWIVSLDGAPPGDYRYQVSGEPAGVIRVSPPD